MTLDQEGWAEALPVHRMYREKGPDHVAHRISGLAVRRDPDGIDRWMVLVRRRDQL